MKYRIEAAKIVIKLIKIVMVCACDFIPHSIVGSSGATEEDLFRNITEVNASLLPCGTLSFCDLTSNEDCYSTPVRSCTQCSIAKGAVLIFFVTLLAMAILIGNILVIFVGRLRYKKRTITKIDYAKTSLAVADMLTGKLLMLTANYFCRCSA